MLRSCLHRKALRLRKGDCQFLWLALTLVCADVFDSHAARALADITDIRLGVGTAVPRGDGTGTRPGGGPGGAAAHPMDGMAALPGDGSAMTDAPHGAGCAWFHFPGPTASALHVAALRAGGRANLKPSS